MNLHHGSFAVQASWTTNVRHSPTFQSDAQPALNKAPSAVLDRSARAFAYSGRVSSRAKPLHPGVDQTSGRNPAAHRIGQVAQARHEKGRTTTGVDKVLAEHGRWETCDYPGARRADAIRQGIRSRQRDRLMEQTTGDTLTGNHSGQPQPGSGRGGNRVPERWEHLHRPQHVHRRNGHGRSGFSRARRTCSDRMDASHIKFWPALVGTGLQHAHRC